MPADKRKPHVMTWLMTENWERQVCAEIECEGRSLREMLMLKKCSITEWSRAAIRNGD